MSLSTPVAFLIFNRPDLTEIVFKAIAKARPKQLLVVADGPRSPEEAEKCLQTRAVIERVDWDCEILCNFSEVNLGCKRRVASGIDWVFSQTEEAIILEDDCLPDPSFFEFCQILLKHYREDERIMHINGGNFLFNQIPIGDSYYFSRYNFGGYGWASWSRAWQNIDLDLKSWPDSKEKKFLEKVFEDPYEQNYWQKLLNKTFNGEIDTWDFQWFYACWAKGGLAITPHVNLVSNLGFRPDATHTNTPFERTYLADMPRGKIADIVHPQSVLRHKEADKHTFETYFGRNNLNQKRQSAFVEKANSMSRPQVAVLVPTYNRWHEARVTLSLLLQSDYENLEIILIEDGCSDDTVENSKKEFPGLTVLHGEGNLWWSGAINKGLNYALNKGAEIIVWINDDNHVEPQTLRLMVDSFNRMGKRSVICARTKSTDTKIKEWVGNPPFWHEESGKWVPPALSSPDIAIKHPPGGRGVLIPAQCFREIGFVDQSTFPHYHADIDFHYRAMKAGFKYYLARDASVWNVPNAKHKDSADQFSLKWARHFLFSRRSPMNMLTLRRLLKRHLSPAAYRDIYFKLLWNTLKWMASGWATRRRLVRKSPRHQTKFGS